MKLPRSTAAVLAFFVSLGCSDDTRRESDDRAASREPPAVADVRIARAGDRFDVRVTGASVGDVLDELADTGGFAIEADSARAGWREPRITLDLIGTSAERAIHETLSQVPHHLHYEWEDGSGPGGPPWPAAPVRLSRVTVGPLYRQPPWRRAQGHPEKPAARTPRTEDVGAGLEDRDSQIRARATAALDPAGTELDALATALRDDPSPEVRRTAARTLAGGRGLHTYPILLEALEDADPEVVVTVIEALEDAYDDHPVAEIYERVAESVQHRDARIRAAARDFMDWVEE